MTSRAAIRLVLLLHQQRKQRALDAFEVARERQREAEREQRACAQQLEGLQAHLAQLEGEPWAVPSGLRAGDLAERATYAQHLRRQLSECQARLRRLCALHTASQRQATQCRLALDQSTHAVASVEQEQEARKLRERVARDQCAEQEAQELAAARLTKRATPRR